MVAGRRVYRVHVGYIYIYIKVAVCTLGGSTVFLDGDYGRRIHSVPSALKGAGRRTSPRGGAEAT